MFNANLDLDKIWLNEYKREQFDEYIVTRCSKGLVHEPLHLFRPTCKAVYLYFLRAMTALNMPTFSHSSSSLALTVVGHNEYGLGKRFLFLLFKKHFLG